MCSKETKPARHSFFLVQSDHTAGGIADMKETNATFAEILRFSLWTILLRHATFRFVVVYLDFPCSLDGFA